MEVKSVTWVEDGVALFPDGVTARGRRHLEELAGLAARGHEAWQVFVVQRADACPFPCRRRRGPGLCPGIGQGRRGRREDPGHQRKGGPPGNYPCRNPPL